jgi:eukaryotic-like serine/threonine-protein kinase
MSQERERDKTARPGPVARTRDERGLQDFRYRAFISYSHEDKSWADWLIKSLETYRIPPRLVGTETPAGTIPRRLSPVFRDRDELASASDLGDTIREALADSATLIVICSPASANSHWVNEEIRAFQQLGRGDHILCLIVDGVPNATDLPGQAYKECFAPALRRAGTAGDTPQDHHTEPIAPDARDEAGGRNVARLKLIAGLLGVGFDVLKRRHQQRRMRRMAAVTALALALTLVTTTLAITAIISRHNADLARQAAERRQKQAEGLINFMLGDLNDKLTEVGRLDIMQSVDDRAMAYFTSLPVADVTDQSLALRATGLQKIGQVRMDQGHLGKALQSFLLAFNIERRLLREAPNDPSRLAAFGNGQNYVGFAYWKMGDLAHAEREFRSARHALERALDARPRDPDIQQNLAEVLNNLAQVLTVRKHPGQAMDLYRRQISLFRDLLARDPDNRTYATNLVVTSINVASFDFENGRLLSSIREFSDTSRTVSTLMARNPKDRELVYYQMLVHAKLAQALHETGRPKAAMAFIRRAVDIGRSLVRIDPSNSNWQLPLSAYSVWEARWQHDMHPASSQALHTLEKQDAILTRMLKANPSDSATRRSLALVQLSLADLALDAGRLRKGDGHVHDALSTLGPITRPTASLAISLRLAVMAQLLLGRIDRAHHAEHVARALALIQPIARTSANPRNLAPWVAALLESGHRQQALAVIERLRSMGYRPPELTALLARRHIDYPPDTEFETQLDSILSTLHVPAADLVAAPNRHAGSTP